MLPITFVSLFLLTDPSSGAPHAAAADATAVAASAAAAVATRAHCEHVWPDATEPPPRRSRACAVQFLAQGYGFGWTRADLATEPVVGGERSWRLTAMQYTRMVEHVARSCEGPCDAVATRAIELFERQATAQLGIVDPWTLESFEPLLAKVLAGEPLDETDLVQDDDLPWSPLTTWKLRSAVFARHGAAFEHPDLDRFFYGDRGPDAMPIDLLPLPHAPATDVVLDTVDRENLQRLWAYEATATSAVNATARRTP